MALGETKDTSMIYSILSARIVNYGQEEDIENAPDAIKKKLKERH